MHNYKIYKFYNYLNKICFNEHEYVYFAFYIDFRGRQYIDSSIGVTNTKLVRTIFYYGKYNSIDYCQSIDNKFLHLLEKYKNEINLIKELFNITISNDKININIFYIMISIGKFFIHKENVKIHFDEFISSAINYLIHDKNSNLKTEDTIEIESYKNLLSNFHDNKKRIIIKDFTASFFQHLTRLLGPQNLKTIELANMHNDLT
jgi:hypothetical protein